MTGTLWEILFELENCTKKILFLDNILILRFH